MGPTNVALLRLFRADQALRDAAAKLDAVTKDVRLQEIRKTQSATKLQAAQARLLEAQAKSGNLDLDLKMREEHIEKLRNQQQQARNNKEYQALLVEINTHKVDRAKVEEQAIKVMEQVEALSAEVKSLATAAESDATRYAEMKTQVSDKAAAAQAEVDKLKPERNAAASQVKPAVLSEFDRLAERYEGEALAPIDKPNPRDEEYLCTGCNLSLVPDVYNKLKTRDDVVTCPSCRRFLYLPDNATFEQVVSKRGGGGGGGGTRTKSDRTVKKIVKTSDEAKIPESKWSTLVTLAQGESVRDAHEADHKPVECKVEINGELVGYFKGKSIEHLERVIRFRMEESKMAADVKVTPIEAPAAPATPAPEATADEQTAGA